ncbi:hypothetical protein CMI37_00465 [Candidatus Pacearchaeota archaeon]|nr:hypothetical protein [Candidatus Pacearchaeota archaeon]|tara:strand:- start:338 stop:598 length:261 start_codon:yes stop_codon:yes gene_type:complete
MPAQSEAQRRAAGAALAAKRKGSSKGLGGASRSMYDMTEDQLEDFASKEMQDLPPVAAQAVSAAESDIAQRAQGVVKAIDSFIKGR